MLSRFFRKGKHDPAKELIKWLEGKPLECRSTISYSFRVGHYDSQVLDWILAQPDCDKGTAAHGYWEAMLGAVGEYAALKDKPDGTTPNLDLARNVAQRWKAGAFAKAQFGCPTDHYWKETCKRLRKYRVKAAELDNPAGLLEQFAGDFARWSPKDDLDKGRMIDLVRDVHVCDLAIEIPEEWVPVRKRRLGY
ncbi:DUF4274 domain-containing protein [Qipengyuania sp. 6B39]|uniref:DUF4274 domain-containing protein n=1 Tax=Qipengyuania proteolytica TaxID=2867239 RepID=UPI001C8B0659|nr:DUF4274 domain-containing protein [Qipengyuania proteolytica]MBX7495435.1 DUF4274 domain-containing protein [Qipengyuania proteolytica]